MTLPAYLTTVEAAQLSGCSKRTLLRRVAECAVPALHLGRVVRVEASGIHASAPKAVPAGAQFRVADLARIWRVQPRLVRLLIREGALVAERRGQTLVVARPDLVRFLAANTTEV